MGTVARSEQCSLHTRCTGRHTAGTVQESRCNRNPGSAGFQHGRHADFCCVSTPAAQEINDREKFLDALLEKYPEAAAAGSRKNELTLGSPLLMVEALEMIQRNERGRAGRQRARIVAMNKRQRFLETEKMKAGIKLMPDEAATRINSAARSYLVRTGIRNLADSEMMFIGMKPKVRIQRRL